MHRRRRAGVRCPRRRHPWVQPVPRHTERNARQVVVFGLPPRPKSYHDGHRYACQAFPLLGLVPKTEIGAGRGPRPGRDGMPTTSAALAVTNARTRSSRRSRQTESPAKGMSAGRQRITRARRSRVTCDFLLSTALSAGGLLIRRPEVRILPGAQTWDTAGQPRCLSTALGERITPYRSQG